MENQKCLESGFKINNLLLIDSVFSRINEVKFGEKVKSEFNISTEVAVTDKTITVAETVTFVQKFEGIEQVNIKVKMVGIFECIGDTILKDYDEFGRINGAAIIFPYIREHITSLSLKSGIGAIILPPVNFTKNKEK